MKYILKRLQSLVAVVLCVIMASAFVSCGDDEEDSEEIIIKANAEGVCITCSGSECEISPYYLWINSFIVKEWDYKDEIVRYPWQNFYESAGRNLTYHSLQSLNVEEYITNIYEETYVSSYPTEEADRMIKEINKRKSQYKYIVDYYGIAGSVYLFNRISDIDY